MSQAGVANLWLLGRLIGPYEFEHDRVGRFDVDGLTGIEQQCEVEALNVPLGELPRVGCSNRDMLDTFDE
jgi:hypothetical protein